MHDPFTSQCDRYIYEDEHGNELNDELSWPCTRYNDQSLQAEYGRNSSNWGIPVGFGNCLVHTGYVQYRYPKLLGNNMCQWALQVLTPTPLFLRISDGDGSA